MSFASVSFLLFFLVVLLLLLLVQRVLDAVLNSDNDGLVHLGGGHHADARLAKAGLLGCFGLFGHWILKVLEYSVVTGNPQFTLPRFHP